MSEMVIDDVATITPPQHRVGSIYNRSFREELHYENLFVEGAEYVFDGNRVNAHWPDLRIRRYGRNDRTCRVRVVRSLESVFDALRPLDEALLICAQNGHAWSPIQDRSGCVVAPYTWRWCLTCGAELVSFCENGNMLTFPEDADEIASRTGGALPTLHGPVLRGTKSEELRLP